MIGFETLVSLIILETHLYPRYRLEWTFARFEWISPQEAETVTQRRERSCDIHGHAFYVVGTLTGQLRSSLARALRLWYRDSRCIQCGRCTARKLQYNAGITFGHRSRRAFPGEAYPRIVITTSCNIGARGLLFAAFARIQGVPVVCVRLKVSLSEGAG